MSRGLLDALSQKAADAILTVGNKKTVPKGTVLFGEREDCSSLYLVLDGFAVLYRSSFQGESRVIFICAEGEVLNEVCLEREKTSVCCKALSDLTVLAVPLEAMEALMGQRPEIAHALFCSLAQKTRRLYHKVGNDNGTYSVKDRLSALLRKLARDYGIPGEAGVTVGFELTVNLLSNMLGAKRETVSRALSELKRTGSITHENGILTLREK